MSIVRWDPFADMATLRDQVNRLFEQNISRFTNEPASMEMWAPRVDILESEEALTLRAELPGISPEDLDIQITGDTLTLKGERKAQRTEKGQQFIRVERTYGAFQRSFSLGVPVKQQEVKAQYRDGILDITLPKAEEARPKQIKVKIDHEPIAVEAK